MAIPSKLVGLMLGPTEHHVDERWTMAYAASLGSVQDCYLDTTRSGGVVAHPLFPVCVEWPVIVASRGASERLGVRKAEVMTGVHATHDLTVHRLIRPGDRLATSLEIVGLADKSPGAMTTTRLLTVDQRGLPVATTTQHAIYLGVGTDGPDVDDPSPPEVIEGVERRGTAREIAVDLGRGAAHIYTECARIWNPIHTDAAVAAAAGLPDIILHGTANLAHGLNAVVQLEAGGQPEQVRRVELSLRGHGRSSFHDHRAGVAGEPYRCGAFDRSLRRARRRGQSCRRPRSRRPRRSRVDALTR